MMSSELQITSVNGRIALASAITITIAYYLVLRQQQQHDKNTAKHTLGIIGNSSSSNNNNNNSKNRLNENDYDRNYSSFRLIRLTPNEECALNAGSMTPISTITWFEGDSCKASDWILKRMNMIISMNPWLKGKFVKIHNHYYIAYKNAGDNNGSNSNPAPKLLLEDNHHTRSYIFTHTQSRHSRIYYGMPHIELIQAGLKYYTLKYKNDTCQPLWKVSVVPCSESPTKYFAVFVSMSHNAGDGHTFYNLHNMLFNTDEHNGHEESIWSNNNNNNNKSSNCGAIHSLQPERILDTAEIQGKYLGRSEATITMTPGYRLCTRRGLLGSALGLVKTSSRIFILDNHKIEETKKLVVPLLSGAKPQHQGGTNDSNNHSFVSTNDIVTSWFLTNCQCSHGMMAINLRGKIDSHHHNNSLAGNYHNSIIYHCPEDTSTPSDIRASVKTLKRVVTCDTKFSNLSMAWNDLGLVTNWAGFSRRGGVANNNIPGCRELVHLPCLDSSTFPSSFMICIIFRVKPGKLGAMILGKTEKVEHITAPFESSERLYD